MNSTAQHSLSPLVQYNQVISSCFLLLLSAKTQKGINIPPEAL